MSRQNVELVRSLFERWRSVATSFDSIFHPEVEWLPLRSATEGPYRGIAGAERFVADTEEVFEKFEIRYELLDLGERVLAWGEIHVRARGSGIETDIPMGGVFDFRDGKIVRWEDFGSKDRALEAIGRGD